MVCFKGSFLVEYFNGVARDWRDELPVVRHEDLSSDASNQVLIHMQSRTYTGHDDTYDFNFSTQEAEAGRSFVSLSLVWSMYGVPGQPSLSVVSTSQPRLHNETQSQKKKDTAVPVCNFSRADRNGISELSDLSELHVQ